MKVLKMKFISSFIFLKFYLSTKRNRAFESTIIDNKLNSTTTDELNPTKKIRSESYNCITQQNFSLIDDHNSTITQHSFLDNDLLSNIMPGGLQDKYCNEDLNFKITKEKSLFYLSKANKITNPNRKAESNVLKSFLSEDLHRDRETGVSSALFNNETTAINENDTRIKPHNINSKDVNLFEEPPEYKSSHNFNNKLTNKKSHGCSLSIDEIDCSFKEFLLSTIANSNGFNEIHEKHDSNRTFVDQSAGGNHSNNVLFSQNLKFKSINITQNPDNFLGDLFIQNNSSISSSNTSYHDDSFLDWNEENSNVDDLDNLNPNKQTPQNYSSFLEHRNEPNSCGENINSMIDSNCNKKQSNNNHITSSNMVIFDKSAFVSNLQKSNPLLNALLSQTNTTTKDSDLEVDYFDSNDATFSFIGPHNSANLFSTFNNQSIIQSDNSKDKEKEFHLIDSKCIDESRKLENISHVCHADTVLQENYSKKIQDSVGFISHFPNIEEENILDNVQTSYSSNLINEKSESDDLNQKSCYGENSLSQLCLFADESIPSTGDKKCFILPYTIMNRRNNTPENNNFSDPAEYLRFVENDNYFIFIYLLNIHNRKNFRRNIKSLESLHIKCAYTKFYESLLDLCDEKFPIVYKVNEYSKLYETFLIYKKWVENKFRIKRMEQNRNASMKFATFTNEMAKKTTSKKFVLDFYIEILKSSNYNFLFEVFPYFELIYRITINKGRNTRSLYIINYLQLIFCKIEALRFYYYYQNDGADGCDVNQYEDQKFNELILIIGIIFRRIMFYSNVSCNTKEVLDIYNFVYFVRAIYNQLFLRSIDLKYFASVDPFINCILYKEEDEEGNFIGLKFSEEFRKSMFLKNILESINTNKKAILRLESHISAYQ